MARTTLAQTEPSPEEPPATPSPVSPERGQAQPRAKFAADIVGFAQGTVAYIGLSCVIMLLRVFTNGGGLPMRQLEGVEAELYREALAYLGQLEVEPTRAKNLALAFADTF